MRECLPEFELLTALSSSFGERMGDHNNAMEGGTGQSPRNGWYRRGWASDGVTFYTTWGWPLIRKGAMFRGRTLNSQNRAHIIVSKRNVSNQHLSNKNHADPVGDMLLKSRRWYASKSYEIWLLKTCQNIHFEIRNLLKYIQESN